MCQLFGISSRDELCINPYLQVFYANSAKHPHGWGLGVLQNGSMQLEKEPQEASKSLRLQAMLARPIVTSLALAHIRYATIGHIELENCHPFTGQDQDDRSWTLLHNGTIFDYPPLAPYVEKQMGETDSERIFLYFLDKLKEKRSQVQQPLSFAQRFAVLDAMVCAMAKGNKLNLLLYDGQYLYAHTNYPNSLYLLEKDNTAVLSTEPLTREPWQPLPLTTLTAFADGKLVQLGTNHGNVFEDNAESLQYLYQIYSSL